MIFSHQFNALAPSGLKVTTVNKRLQKSISTWILLLNHRGSQNCRVIDREICWLNVSQKNKFPSFSQIGSVNQIVFAKFWQLNFKSTAFEEIDLLFVLSQHRVLCVSLSKHSCIHLQVNSLNRSKRLDLRCCFDFQPRKFEYSFNGN